MKKGKIKFRRKLYSIMVVPHQNGTAKTLTVAYFKFKIILLLLLFILLITVLTLSFNHIKSLNNEIEVIKYDMVNIEKKLTEEHNEEIKNLAAQYEQKMSSAINVEQSLNNLIKKQNVLLDQKSETLQVLIDEDSEIENKIQVFSENIQEMISQNVGQVVSGAVKSRSEEQSSKDFLEKLSELYVMLNSITSMEKENDNGLIEFNLLKEQITDFLDKLPTLRPVNGEIGSEFGFRLHPIYQVEKLHTGVDFIVNMGVEIHAAGSGTVHLSEYYGGYGNCIIIDHGMGITSFYAHCSKLLVSKGDTVKKGDIIALVGSTGLSTGPHLHFEVRLDNIPVDPEPYLYDE